MLLSYEITRKRRRRDTLKTKFTTSGLLQGLQVGGRSLTLEFPGVAWIKCEVGMDVQYNRSRSAAAMEWRAHWPLVMASMLGYTMIGVTSFSVGAFIAPLEKAFGWSRSEITSGMTVYAAACVICQPFVGRMIDRWGPRPVALAGIVLTGITFSLFGTASGSLVNWLLLWLSYSLAAQLILTPVWTSAVASEFESGRGLALAVTLSGAAISGVVVPITSTLVIDSQGWRAAYAILGGTVAAILCAVTWFFFFSRRDRLRYAEDPAALQVASGSTTREALRSPAFWKLAVGILCSFSLLMSFTIHMLPLLTSIGQTRNNAALIAGSYGLFAVVGKVSYGLLANRFKGHVVAAVMVLLPIASCALLLVPHASAATCIAAISLIGISSGAQLQLLVYLTTRHFGLRAYGTIFGFIGSSLTIASGLGPLLASRLYDITGDYHLLLLAGIPLSIIASVLLLWVGDYREPQRRIIEQEPGATLPGLLDPTRQQ